ncbi:flippase [soil metagenome]
MNGVDPQATPPSIETNAAWLRFIPVGVRARFDNRRNLQAVLSNTSWLISDRVLRMGVGLIVGVWIARYLGPAQFGLWSYATAFAYLFSAVATLGLDSIVIRELVRQPARRGDLLGTAFAMKLIASVGTLAAAVVTIAVVKDGDALTIRLAAIAAAGFVFQSVNVIDFYFQSETKARFTVYASNAAFLITTLVKVMLLVRRAPLVAFAWAGLAEIVLTSAFLVVAYRANKQRLSSWKFRTEIAMTLLRDSWPLVFSGMAVGVFMKIDQIMLEAVLDERAVGLYSAAVRVSEVWYFIGTVVVASVAPTIYLAKQQNEAVYREKLQLVFSLVSWLAIAISIVLALASSRLIRVLYGPDYAEAAGVLMIHTWATLFVFVGVAQGIYWIAENLQVFSLVLTIAAAVANIALNVYLIPAYGITGAAIATLLSYGVPTLVLPVCFRKTRPVVHMFLRGLTMLPRL